MAEEKEKTEELKSEKNTEAEDVVFATVELKSGTYNMDDEYNDNYESKSNEKNKNNKKRKFPVIPVVASAAALCVAASVAIIVMSQGKNDIVSPESSVSVTEKSDDSATESVKSSSQGNSETNDQPLIIEHPLEISHIDTSSIVFGNNVTVEGVELAGKTLAQAFDAMQEKFSSLREPISISVECEGKNVSLTQDDFEYDSDIANVLMQAYHYSRGELESPTVVTTRNGDIVDFKITSALNKHSVSGAVKKAADTFDILPVNASVTKFDPTKTEKFTYADGKNGFMIDQKELSDKIGNILNLTKKQGSISIKKNETPFEITLPILKANTKLIASTYTTAANVWASNYNMELAIKSASGTIVKPGETFSFNKMTGDTTNGLLGYIPSTAIVRGEYVQSYGGGICQASTTLYLCALRADMEPVERWAHAYPSVYADRGLDATVDYGNLDMKFKNTKDYPIYIATYVYDYDYDGLDELLVEMYGPLSTEYDEIIPVGWVSSAGYDGYYAKGAKVYFKNGREIKRVYTPGGSYDYKYDTYSSALARIPADPEFGPKDVTPTMKPPAVFSPNGCGSNAPVAYGKAAEYLEKAKNEKTESKPAEQSSNASSQTSEQSSSAPAVSSQVSEATSSAPSQVSQPSVQSSIQPSIQSSVEPSREPEPSPVASSSQPEPSPVASSSQPEPSHTASSSQPEPSHTASSSQPEPSPVTSSEVSSVPQSSIEQSSEQQSSQAQSSVEDESPVSE